MMSTMLKELVARQKASLDFFYKELDSAACTQFVEALHACTGTLFFTGVGKSGFIAQKLAATLLSTSIRAFFLPPLDALHGDLGMVQAGDGVVFLSKSGETKELLELLPFIRARGALSFAMTSEGSSHLAHLADHRLLLPCPHELCPFDLAPTLSTEVQLIGGDLVIVALMQKRGCQLTHFASNHPGGRIGRRLALHVEDMMLDRKETPFCLPDHCLGDVLVDFTDKKCGCLVVVDEQMRLHGIFTDGDLRRALQREGKQLLEVKMKKLMTPSPKAISKRALAWEALKLMEADCPITVLPVVDEQKEEVVGLVKLHDLIQAGL